MNWSAAEVGEVPPGRRHADIDRAGAGGEVAVIEVAELTVKPVAAVRRSHGGRAREMVPVMVTVVPPARTRVGEMDVTVGGAE